MLYEVITPRDIKVNLAKNICSQFYDDDTAEKALLDFNQIFVKKDIPDDIPEFQVPAEEIKDGKIWIIKLMTLGNLASSNGEARRLIRITSYNVCYTKLLRYHHHTR